MGNTHTHSKPYKKTKNAFKTKNKKPIYEKDIPRLVEKKSKAMDKIMDEINSNISELNKLNDQHNQNEITNKSFENDFNDVKNRIEALSNALRNAKLQKKSNEQIPQKTQKTNKVRFSIGTKEKGGTRKK
jgi:chromosome segregation ATPase